MPPIFFSFLRIFVTEIDKDNAFLADSLRYLFDPHNTLYAFHFAQQAEGDMLRPGLAVSEEKKRENAWRAGLQIGDPLDAVKVDPRQAVKTWARARIIDIQNEHMTITFERESKDFDRAVKRDG